MLRDCFSKEAKLFLPIISGVLLSVVSLNSELFMFVFFALIPLFYRLRQVKSFKEYLVMLILYFFTSNFLQLSFILKVSQFIPDSQKYAKPLLIIAVILLSLYLTLVNIIPMLIFTKVRTNKIYDVFLFSSLYILSEWFCENVPLLSFPWIRLGTILSDFYIFLQSASIFGGLFISFLILVINGLVANAFCSENSRRLQYFSLLSAMIIFSANSVYGLAKTHFTKTQGQKVSCMLLQENMGAEEKWDVKALQSLEAHYRLASSSITANNRPDIIVMPETAINSKINENITVQNALSRFAQNLNATLITGGFYRENDKTYNALYVVNPDGTIEKPYLKSKLVPFGEYIPLEKTIKKIVPSVTEILRTKKGLSAFDKSDTVKTVYGKITSLICLESIYSAPAREQCQNGGELIAIISNDAWFGDDFNLTTHFRHSVMRAVECSKYVVNCANSGISAIITPYGKLSVKAPERAKSAVMANVIFTSKNTPYSFWGDIIILPSVAVIVWGIIKTASKMLAKKLRK